jgi:hypothetical protein
VRAGAWADSTIGTGMENFHSLKTVVDKNVDGTRESRNFEEGNVRDVVGPKWIEP